MGEIADLMINGDICEGCGEELGEGDDFPRRCPACQRDTEIPAIPKAAKVSCPICKRRVKAIGLQQHQRDAHGKYAPDEPSADAQHVCIDQKYHCGWKDDCIACQRASVPPTDDVRDAARWREANAAMCYSFDGADRTYYLMGSGRDSFEQIIDKRLADKRLAVTKSATASQPVEPQAERTGATGSAAGDAGATHETSGRPSYCQAQPDLALPEPSACEYPDCTCKPVSE